VLRAQGKADEAIAEYRTAIALDPKFASPHSNLGNVLSAQGKADEAIAEYRTAIALDPKFVYPHYNIGVLLRDRATPNLSPGVRDAMLAEACQHFVIGAQIALTERDYYSAAMRSIERRLANRGHCPPH
jgi:tetratricopeptide (TPR) repeat protein